MAQLLTTIVTGKVSATLPASGPQDYTRLQEIQAMLAGKSDVGHTHTAADIMGLDSVIPSFAGDSSIGIQLGTPNVISVNLHAGGGLARQTDGLSVDPAFVSMVGHKHVLGDITDFAPATFLPSASIGWVMEPAGVSGVVRLKSGGGLLTDAAAGSRVAGRIALRRPHHLTRGSASVGSGQINGGVANRRERTRNNLPLGMLWKFSGSQKAGV